MNLRIRRGQKPLFFIDLVVVDDERNALAYGSALGDMGVVLQITSNPEAKRTRAIETLGHAAG